MNLYSADTLKYGSMSLNSDIIHSINQLINNNLIWFIVIDVILCNPQANALYKWSWLGTDYLTWRGGGYGFENENGI
jgi:hypothetical protein